MARQSLESGVYKILHLIGQVWEEWSRCSGSVREARWMGIEIGTSPASVRPEISRNVGKG